MLLRSRVRYTREHPKQRFGLNYFFRIIAIELASGLLLLKPLEFF